MATPRKTTAKYRYRLRVELEGVTPVIWREIWVEGQMSLTQLHHILQAAMGWTDAHLHQFTIAGKTYATPHPEDDSEREVIDERKVALHKVLNRDLQFHYDYDFGDSWRHLIRVEEVKPQTNPYGAAYVDAGARACPPEDSGGSGSYQDFLGDLKSRPKSKEVKSFLQWAGKDFDPDRFDRHAANAALLRMAWNHWGER